MTPHEHRDAAADWRAHAIVLGEVQSLLLQKAWNPRAIARLLTWTQQKLREWVGATEPQDWAKQFGYQTEPKGER